MVCVNYLLCFVASIILQNINTLHLQARIIPYNASNEPKSTHKMYCAINNMHKVEYWRFPTYTVCNNNHLCYKDLIIINF